MPDRHVPFRVWASYGVFLVTLGALLTLGLVWLLDALHARPTPPLGLLLLLPLMAVATMAAVAAARLPPRMFWPSFAAVAGAGMLVGAAMLASLLAPAPGCDTASGPHWLQADLFQAMAGRGAEVAPPVPGWEGPWANVTVLGIAYADVHEPRGTHGFYLRHDGRLLTLAGPWSNGTEVDLYDMAARLTATDPAPWGDQLRLGRAVALPPLERLPDLLEELAARSLPVPADRAVGHASLTAGLWRLDLSSAVASVAGRLLADPFGGAQLRGPMAIGEAGNGPAPDGLEQEQRAAAAAWMAEDDLPFRPRWFYPGRASC